MLYRRGDVWWYKFNFAGRTYRESTKSSSKDIARRAETKRRRDLEEGIHGLRKREAPQTFKAASAAWLELKKPTLAKKSYLIETTNLSHILTILGLNLLTDIDAADNSRYQQTRLKEKAAPKTINLEVGTIRAILRRHRLWANLQPDVRMLNTPDDIGKALAPRDEKKLLNACADSRSRSLLPAVLLALNTGMRYSELQLLRWEQVDLTKRSIRVGRSKTEAGTGRTVPLNDKATKVLQFWAEQFPERRPDHFVFPSERYGAGNKFEPTVYGINPTKPGSWKEAWESAKDLADVSVRFHDLRHTVSRECWKAGLRSRSWRRFSGGVRRRQSGLRSATATSVRWRRDRPSSYWMRNRNAKSPPAARRPRGVGTKMGTVGNGFRVCRQKTLEKTGSSGWTRTRLR